MLDDFFLRNFITNAVNLGVICYYRMLLIVSHIVICSPLEFLAWSYTDLSKVSQLN